MQLYHQRLSNHAPPSPDSLTRDRQMSRALLNRYRSMFAIIAVARHKIQTDQSRCWCFHPLQTKHCTGSLLALTMTAMKCSLFAISTHTRA